MKDIKEMSNAELRKKMSELEMSYKKIQQDMTVNLNKMEEMSKEYKKMDAELHSRTKGFIK
jgi:hypothetical protein